MQRCTCMNGKRENDVIDWNGISDRSLSLCICKGRAIQIFKSIFDGNIQEPFSQWKLARSGKSASKKQYFKLREFYFSL